jgi:hypothetical protein
LGEVVLRTTVGIFPQSTKSNRTENEKQEPLNTTPTYPKILKLLAARCRKQLLTEKKTPKNVGPIIRPSRKVG